MKSKLLLVSLLFVLQSAFAYQYDVIITKSREQIQCVILSQDENAVTYQTIDSNNAETIIMSKSEIEKIYPRSEESTPQVVTPKTEQPKDIIVLKDATRLEAIITEITDSEIKYKEPNNERILFSKKIADVSVVLFSNGETRVFNNAPSTPQSASSKVAETTSLTPNYTPQERPQANDAEWAGGGIHTDKNGNTRTDFPGGHKTVYADGSEQISVPFVTINKKGGGRGVEMPNSDDIKGFQLIEFYGDPQDDVILINKSSKSDCFKVAICSVKNNQYFWKIVLTTKELEPYKADIKKQKEKYRAKSEEELNDLLNNKDRFIYSVAVKSRYGYEYAFKTYKDGDDLVIEVLDPNSHESDW